MIASLSLTPVFLLPTLRIRWGKFLLKVSSCWLFRPAASETGMIRSSSSAVKFLSAAGTEPKVMEAEVGTRGAGAEPAASRLSLVSPPSPGPPSRRRPLLSPNGCRVWGLGQQVQIWERRAGRGISSGDLRSSALHCDAENNSRGRESLSATHRPQMPHDATFAAYAFLRQSGLLTAATPQMPQRRKSRNGNAAKAQRRTCGGRRRNTVLRGFTCGFQKSPDGVG